MEKMKNQRPLVTFALFAYNQEGYIEDAVVSALSQDYSPLQVILSDDYSSDQTFEIIKRLANSYNGPHRVLINRNQKNLGIGAHVNHIFSMCEGEWFVLAAGDDISDPRRTREVINHVKQSPREVDCVSVQALEIDSEGKETGRVFNRYKKGDLIHYNQFPGAALAYSRRVRDLFPQISERVHNEDIVLFSRAMLLSRVGFVNLYLVKYRAHSGNRSTRNKFSDLNDEWLDRKRRGASRVIAMVDQIELDLKGKEETCLHYWPLLVQARKDSELVTRMIDSPSFLNHLDLFRIISRWHLLKIAVGLGVVHLRFLFGRGKMKRDFD